MKWTNLQELAEFLWPFVSPRKPWPGWKVQWKKNLQEGGDFCWGLCRFSHEMIQVDSSLRGTNISLVETVLHELIHCALNEGGHGKKFQTRLRHSQRRMTHVHWKNVEDIK